MVPYTEPDQAGWDQAGNCPALKGKNRAEHTQLKSGRAGPPVTRLGSFGNCTIGNVKRVKIFKSTIKINSEILLVPKLVFVVCCVQCKAKREPSKIWTHF